MKSTEFSRVEVATKGVNPIELIHKLRNKSKEEGAVSQSEGRKRVESGYHLNEMLSGSPSRRLLKNSVNAVLNVARLGDSLKVWAIK